MKYKRIKIIFIILGILLIIPSVLYMIENESVMKFDTYYNFFINIDLNKTISTIIYLVLFIGITIAYLIMVKNYKKLFENTKQILKYVAIISIIFTMMLPWTDRKSVV